jgi:hypothetical protein
MLHAKVVRDNPIVHIGNNAIFVLLYTEFIRLFISNKVIIAYMAINDGEHDKRKYPVFKRGNVLMRSVKS